MYHSDSTRNNSTNCSLEISFWCKYRHFKICYKWVFGFHNKCTLILIWIWRMMKKMWSEVSNRGTSFYKETATLSESINTEPGNIFYTASDERSYKTNLLDLSHIISCFALYNFSWRCYSISSTWMKLRTLKRNPKRNWLISEIELGFSSWY